MKTKSGRTRQESPAANDQAFKLEDFLPYRLSVAANRVSRLCARRYTKAFGLSIPEWRVLAVVGRFDTLSPSAVGEWTAMDKVKVSRAAASLVARGELAEARVAARQLMQVQPHFRLGPYEQRCPFQGAALERWMERLRAAGLPE